MSEERELLRETVAALVAKHASPAAVRAAIESEKGYDESLWQLLCQQVGAAALVIPEELGGAGGELADAATVLQELGRALVPSPLLGTTLAELALLAAPEPDTEALEALAEGSSIGALVLDADYVVNGDIASYEDAVAALAASGADAVMIGRGAQGRPWLPGQIARQLAGGATETDPALDVQLGYLRTLYDDILSHYGARIGLRHARKHLGWGLDVAEEGAGAGITALKEWRGKILTSERPDDVHALLDQAFDSFARSAAA